MQPISLHHKRRGFSLVEAIAGILVMSIAVPPMILAVSDAQIRRAGITQASRARWLATERLEDMIADRHSSTRGYDYLHASNYTDESDIQDAPGFTRRVQIAETGPDLVTPGAGYKHLTVMIDWVDPEQGPTTLSISTVVTDYP